MSDLLRGAELITAMRDEADLCRNETAVDCANLFDRGASELEDCLKRIAELEAERDALKVDAERYRWLVEEHASDGPSWHVRLPNNEVPGVDLSSLIDAAIKEQQ